MKKKLFSVILTLCMALSLFFGNSASADAADKTIYTVIIESIPTMEIGGSIADAKAIFLDVPEGCIADSHWHIWDASANDGYGEWKEIHEGTFTETDLYYLCITFKTAEGYTFSDSFEVSYLDGVEEGNVWGSYDDNDNLTWHCDMPVESFATTIYDIFVTTPEVVPGNTATLDEIEFYSGDKVIPKENFDIDAKWICETHNYEDVTGQKFEDGCYYSFDLSITPHAGYYFFNELNVLHNGVVDELAFDVAPTHYNYYYGKSLLPAIEKIELAGLPSVKTGETMVDSLESLSDLEALNCDISVEWWDENGEDTVGEKMKAGHVYTMQIEVNSFGQSPLSKDFVFIIDGTEYKATSIDELNEQPAQAWLELEYDLSNSTSTDDYDNFVLDKLELTGLPSVKAGEIMVESLDIESPSDDINIYFAWFDENGKDVTGETMEEGHVYTLKIEAEAYMDYSFSKNFVFVIDGNEYEPTDMDELNAQAMWAHLELEYDLDDNADNVVIDDNDTTSPKTGDSSMIMVWMLLAAVSMGTIVFARKRQ